MTVTGVGASVPSRVATAPGRGPVDLDAVLVVGYGNALRSDDGFGWHVATAAMGDPRLAGATILRRHQLTPELALDVSRASLVVFVDAAHGVPGSVSVRALEAVTATDGGTSMTHHLDAAVLLALTAEIYGSRPLAWEVGVGVASMDAGETLSESVARQIDVVLDAIVGLASAPHVGHAPGTCPGGLHDA